MRSALKYIFAPFAISIAVFSHAIAFYDDVPTTFEYYDPIKNLYTDGLLPETPDNQFHPQDLVTTAELYKFLLTFGKADLNQTPKLPYSNISNNSEYAPYLQTALDLGILHYPAPNASFNLQAKIPKEQALRILFNSLGVGTSSFFDKSQFPFEDLDPNSQAAATAYKAAEIGILEQGSPTAFYKAKRITRGELADYLYKIQQYAPGPANIEIKYVKNISYDEKTDLQKNENYEILENVYDTLNDNYYYSEQIDQDNLIFGAIEGLVNEAGDQYTVFQRPDTANNFLSSLSQEYEGVGMQIDIIDGDITVVTPLKDSPAEKAGLKSGDIIIKVNGQDVTNQSLQSVTNMIRGAEGSTVKITVIRNGSERDFSVTRAKISNITVQHELLQDHGKKIGYIEMVNFSRQTYDEFVTAAENLIKENPDGFIIDLRNNPGGYMDIAIDITSLFTDRIRNAVQLEFANGALQNYKTDGNGLLKDYPIVVLINEGSASASEILAGALQDFKRATLIGNQSFGKGSVQQLYQYSNGALFKFTISKWHTPNGRDINKKGLTPDIKVSDYDDQLKKALDQF